MTSRPSRGRRFTAALLEYAAIWVLCVPGAVAYVLLIHHGENHIVSWVGNLILGMMMWDLFMEPLKIRVRNFRNKNLENPS